MPSPLSRRDLLEKCAALAVLLVAPPFQVRALASAFEEGALAPRPATTPGVLGPFYKRGAPTTHRLSPDGTPGLPLGVSGRVFETSGAVLAGAVVDVWHASHAGIYDNQGFLYRGRMAAGEKGDYAFESILPGHYPDRVAQHVHFMVSAPGHKPLITQLYFATDPAFEGDPDHNFRKDPLVGSRELIRPVTIAGDPGAPKALVTFELVLNRA